MPGYRKHMSFGYLCYVSSVPLMFHFIKPSPFLMVELLLALTIGALFPDVDIKSKGQQCIYSFLFLISMPLIYYEYEQQLVYFLWISLLPMMVKHRGMFHNPLFLTLAIGASWYVLYVYNIQIAIKAKPHFIYFLMGNLSHLILDYGCLGLIRRVQGKNLFSIAQSLKRW